MENMRRNTSKRPARLEATRGERLGEEMANEMTVTNEMKNAQNVTQCTSMKNGSHRAMPWVSGALSGRANETR